MENVRTVIWDCDNVMWFHKDGDSRMIAKEFGIKELEEFEIQFCKMVKRYNNYFCKKMVTITETYKIIEREMPILGFYGISAEKFMNTWRELKIEMNEPNIDAIILMKYLQEKGIKNIIKSDWWKDFQIILLKGSVVL